LLHDYLLTSSLFQVKFQARTNTNDSLYYILRVSVLAQPHPPLLGGGGWNFTILAPKLSWFAYDALTYSYDFSILSHYDACYNYFIISFFFFISSKALSLDSSASSHRFFSSGVMYFTFTLYSLWSIYYCPFFNKVK